MTFYASMIPFFIATIALGTLYLGWQFQRQGRNIVRGATLGALAGAVGPLIFQVPLQSCTFAPEVEPIDYTFGLVFFFLGAWLIIFMAQYFSSFFHPDVDKRPSIVANQKSTGTFRASFLVPTALLTPTLIILVFFLYYPAYETFRLSTFRYRLGAPRTPFKCVENFTELINPEYGEVMLTTMWMSVAIVVIGLVLSLIIAYAAYQPVKGASIYRTLLIWPYAISPAVAGIIFFVMFDPIAGVVNHLSELFLSVSIPKWSENGFFAQWVIILASVWKTLGYNILFYIAGLQNVPKELVEAAAIDGANFFQRFRNIVIPMLSPITFFLIITNLTYAFFETYGTIDYLTRGGPTGATTNAIYNIILVAKEEKWLGRASAQSVVLFAIVILVTIWQFRTSGRRVNYGS